jgi:hypothetical protein
MKATHPYVVIGAAATVAVALAWANQSGQTVNAQNTINQTQTQSDQLDRSTNLQNPPVQGQNQPRSHVTPGKRMTQVLKASELMGMNVRGKSGDDGIGEVKDVVIGKDGKVDYIAVSFGGFLGLGDKLFAVPFEAIEFVDEGDNVGDEHYARIDVTEEALKSKPGFNEENWPDQPDVSFLRQGAAARTARQTDRVVPPARDSQQPPR